MATRFYGKQQYHAPIDWWGDDIHSKIERNRIKQVLNKLANDEN